MAHGLTTEVCAVVPARGGSQGVPRKNLRTVGGVPLITRAVQSLAACANVDRIVVSTDDEAIAEQARKAGAEIIDRPVELAGSEASSESALLHALAELVQRDQRPDVLVFVQATSPFISPEDVDRAVAAVRDGDYDVAFSATRADVHLWHWRPDGPRGINHDAARRLRRQDREPEWAETGAFYAMDTDGFVASEHRFFGRSTIVEVSPADSIDIDTEHDLVMADAMAATRDAATAADDSGQHPAAAAAGIPARAVVTDFDGVHTPDTVFVDQDGVESVQVNRSDGMGVARLREAGIPFLVLSSEVNPVVQTRARKLGVDVISGSKDKLGALKTWAQHNDVDLADVTYLGNDVNDVDCLQAVGWPAVVADAQPDARAAAQLVLRHRGGCGAVRELAERVLAATDHTNRGAPQQRGMIDE